MFTKLFSGMCFQREAGAFSSAATKSQKAKYKRAINAGYSQVQSVRIAKGSLVRTRKK